MIDNGIRAALSNPMKQALDKYELRNVPTLMELKLGNPSGIEGVTSEAKSLAMFAKSMQNYINDVAVVHFRANADSTLTDGDKLSRSAEFATKKINAARVYFKDTYKNALPAIENYKSKINQVLKPPADSGEAGIDAELRSLLRTQDQKNISKLLRENPAALAAAARAPAILSGLSEDVYKRIQHEYLEKVIPDELGAYDELIHSVLTAEKALSTLEEEAKTLIDFDSAAKIQSRKFVEL